MASHQISFFFSDQGVPSGRAEHAVVQDVAVGRPVEAPVGVDAQTAGVLLPAALDRGPHDTGAVVGVGEIAAVDPAAAGDGVVVRGAGDGGEARDELALRHQHVAAGILHVLQGVAVDLAGYELDIRLVLGALIAPDQVEDGPVLGLRGAGVGLPHGLEQPVDDPDVGLGLAGAGCHLRAAS